MKKAQSLLIVLFFLFSNYSIGQNCRIGTDDPPGCLHECVEWSALNEPFSVDDPIIGQNCSPDGLSRWFRAKTVNSFFSVAIQKFNCNSTTEIYLQIFDDGLNPISTCKKFINDGTFGFLAPDSLITRGQELIVRVELNEPIGCDFSLRMQGIAAIDPVLPPYVNILGDFQSIEGTISLGPIQNTDSINWTSNPSMGGVIESGQGTSTITYSKPRFERAELSVRLMNDCGSPRNLSIILDPDESFCTTNSESFPGCEFNCHSFWTLDEPFVSSNSACGNTSFSKWLKVKAADETITVKSDRNLCLSNSNFSIQLYDDQQNALGPCTAFFTNNYSTQEFTASNLTPGDDYSILIETNTSLGCDFRLLFEGIEIGTLPDVEFIDLETRNGIQLDSARIEPVSEASSYLWEISEPSISIISGQGLSSISFENPNNLPAEICVTPKSACKIGTKFCKNIAVSSTAGVQRPCCVAPDTPSGCSDAGITLETSCIICNLAGIYQGNNKGYGAVGEDFSCGFPHNSAFVSLVADANGVIDATIILSNCSTPDGLTLILFDEVGNEIDCFNALGGVASSFGASGLTPGGLYTFQLDGIWGTYCDYTIIVSGSGNTVGLPDPPGPIMMTPDTTLCPMAEVCFEIAPVNNANTFEWILPANLDVIAGGGLNDLFVCGVVQSAGGGAVRVTPSNFCNVGVPGILPIVALPIPPTIWPVLAVCQSDMPFDTTICGQTITVDQFGAHQIVCTTQLGCDSVINFSLIPRVQVPSITDTTITAGTCFMFEDSCYFEGSHTIILQNSVQANGCDSIVVLMVEYDSTIIVTSDFTIDVFEICPGETATFTFTGTASANADFNWDFGNATIVSGSDSGPYVVRFNDNGDIPITLSVTDSGVTSAPTTNFIGVYPSLLPLSLTCNSTVDEVIYNWVNDPNVSNYLFNVSTGQTGVQDGNAFFISNLNPNEVVVLEVVAESFFGCASITEVQTCVAQDCPTVDVVIDPIAPICLTSNTLSIQLTGQAGNNNGIFEWSGTGVSSSGEFNPNAVGPGSHPVTLNYSVGACVYSATTTVQVNQTPVAAFSASPIICENDLAVFNFTGSASSNAIYNWDFANGNVVSGSGAGPYEVAFSTAGVKTVSLKVEENGCVSNISTQTITVDEPLEPTIITCTSDQSNVYFEWDFVPNALSYTVSVVSAPATAIVSQPTQNTFNVSDLIPGDEVQIEVVVEGLTSCGSITMTGDCIAQDCPIISVDIEPVNDICLTSATQPIQLNATAGTNTGTFTFSGNGVSNLGVFDPQMATLGTNVIIAEYTDGSCSYSATINVEVNQTPDASFTVESPICESEMSTIAYTGSALSNAVFNWDFGRGTVATGSNSGPYEVSFPFSSNETISLSVEENGCTSILEINTIQVDQSLTLPVVTCQNATTSEVSFGWNNDPNVQNYQVNSTIMGVLDGTVYTVSGLNPGDEVTIEVVGISNNSCPSVISSLTCLTSNCPPLNLAIDPVQDLICEGDSSIVQLTVTNSSPTQNGTYTWSGGNVTSDGKFNTGGLAAGDYSVTVEYDETGCLYSTSQIVTIESSPDIDATINSPIWFLGGTGSIELDISNGLPPYNVNWSTATIGDTILNNLNPGPYSVTLTDQNGCLVTEDYTVADGAFTVNPVHIICAGDLQPLNVMPGTGATFSWSPSFRLSCDDCANPVANPTRTTVYTVAVTLPDGRTASQNVVVVVLPSIICSGLQNDDDKDLAKLLSDFDFETLEEKDLIEIDKRISDFYLEKEVKVVPNPTNGIVNIHTPEKVESINVFDFSGKLLKSEKEKQINLSNFSKGVYFFKIKISNQVIIKKVILI